MGGPTAAGASPLLGVLLFVDGTRGGARLVFRFPTAHRAAGLTQETTALLQKPSGEMASAAASSAVAAAAAAASSATAGVLDGPAGWDRSGRKFAVYNKPSVVLAPMLTPRTSLCGASFELQLEETLFLGFPVHHQEQTSVDDEDGPLLPSGSGGGGSGGSDTTTQRHQEEMRLFHLVFALHTSHATPAIRDRYRNFAIHLARAMLHEQQRCGWLYAQVHLMLHAREVWLTLQRQPPEGAGSSGSAPASASQPRPLGHAALTRMLLKCSSLAADLRSVYDGLAQGENSHVCFNRWTDVYLSLQSPMDQPPSPIRPYQTLLLLQTEEKLLAELPKDAIHSLRRLVQRCSPTKTFAQLQLETNIPLAQVFRLAGHLMYWGKARVIERLAPDNVYVLNHQRELDCSPGSPLLLDFERDFPGEALPRVLALFGQGKPLRELVGGGAAVGGIGNSTAAVAAAVVAASAGGAGGGGGGDQFSLLFTHMVIWLLRNDVLQQLKLHVYLTTFGLVEDAGEEQVGPERGSGAGLGQDGESGQGADGRQDGVVSVALVSQRALSPAARAVLTKKYSGDPRVSPEDLEVFLRLCEHFNQGHSLEEICWRQSVARSRFHRLLDLFADDLLQSWC